MKAADLVPLIKKAAAVLMKAETDAFRVQLKLSIELGKLLIQAQQDAEVGTHGKWIKWFKEQRFEFSLRKAQRSIRHANREQELQALNAPSVAHLAADLRLGINEAEAILKKPKTRGTTKRPPPEQKATQRPEQATKPRPVTTDEEARVEQARAEEARAKAEAEAEKARQRTAEAEAEREKAAAAREFHAFQKAQARANARRAEAEWKRAERAQILSSLLGRKKVEIHSSARTLLVKALGMLGSKHNGEVLNAARKAEEQREKLNATWDQLIVQAADRAQAAE